MAGASGGASCSYLLVQLPPQERASDITKPVYCSADRSQTLVNLLAQLGTVEAVCVSIAFEVAYGVFVCDQRFAVRGAAV